MNRTNRKSTRLKLVAVAEDEANSEFIALIDFRDINGHIRRLEQPRSTLRKIDHLREACCVREGSERPSFADSSGFPLNADVTNLFRRAMGPNRRS
jgi:hypothetical protein